MEFPPSAAVGVFDGCSLPDVTWPPVALHAAVATNMINGTFLI
jgi:hypothetical protein